MTFCITSNKPHAQGTLELSDAAIARARLTFHPSGLASVDRIKTLAAALYTELEYVVSNATAKRADSTVDTEWHATVLREAATAATHIQAGAMFAVSAATARP